MDSSSLATLNYRLMEHYVSGSRGIEGQMSPVRRFFCLFVTFDFLFTCLLWLLCLVLSNKSLIDAIEIQIVNYSIYTSTFDVLLLAATRFIPLLLFYGLIQINHWWTVAITMFTSSAFLVTKVFFYEWNNAQANTTFSIVLLLCSFVLTWGEVWLLDFRVIPRERQAIDLSTKLYPSEQTPLLRGMLTPRTDEQAFYSPVATPPDSDDEGEDAVSSYVHQVNDVSKLVNEVMNGGGWTTENQLDNGDVIQTNFDCNLRKIYKFTGLLHSSPRLVFQELYCNAERSPSWNPSLLFCKVLKQVDESTDIIYQVAAEGGGGLVSSRDFVDLRSWEMRGDDYVTIGISIQSPLMPLRRAYVRGENGPCAWIMESLPEEPDVCRLHWLLNTNLKGWLPQYLIDQTLAGVMLDFIKHLRNHLSSLQATSLTIN